MSKNVTTEDLLIELQSIQDESLLKKKTLSIFETLLIDMIHQGSTADDHFWAYIFMSVKRDVDFTLPTPMAITFEDNHFYILLNPKHWDITWTKPNIKEIIKHEGYHVLFNHLHMYRDVVKHNPKLMELVKIATDCEINQHLENLPDDGHVTIETVAKIANVHKHNVERKAGSSYYLELMLKNPKVQELMQQGNNPQSNEKSDGDGSLQSTIDGAQNNLDSHTKWVSANDKSYMSSETVAKNIVNNAQKSVERTNGRGSLSSDLSELIQKLNMPPQIPWQKLVQQRMGKQVYGKRDSINRLNRRTPFALHKKGKLPDRVAPIICAFDTSGSISDRDLAYFYNEVYNISKRLRMPITLIQFDTEIKNVQEITSANNIKYTADGRGGTSFQPVFDYLKENQVDTEAMIFIFTDGYGESSINPYRYHKHNWIITKGDTLSIRDNTRPVIYIDNQL